MVDENFETWLNRDKKKKSGTYRERVLSGEQEDWKSKGRKRLNAFSKKGRAKGAQYENAKQKYLAEHPECEICGRTDNLSVHHKAKRGDLVDDPDFFMTLCLTGTWLDEEFPELNHNHSGGCHGFIHANSRFAREQGYLFTDTEVQRIKDAKNANLRERSDTDNS